ncbi:MAG: lysylphosphatidylglycerol synthase transmembrane domain-containing protein, partial [Candidatus Omnitrophota bacterium]|nr:lysylphosphatidylglycerol synthase transmembrane domain-containing protein [Candidatus Omnitrophota bacterium]
MNIKTIISGILRFTISIVLMAVLIYFMRDSLPSMMATLRQTSLYFFAVGAAIYTLSILIASLRLRIFLRLQGIKMRVRDVFRVNLIGYFFSSFLPTSIGGDIVKAIYISRESGKKTQAYISIFIDRFIGMFTIFLIATAAVFAVKDTSGFHLVWLLPALIVLSLVF